MTESLYSGKQALAALSPEAREEIEALFPNLHTTTPVTARIVPCRKKLKTFIARVVARLHRQNFRGTLQSA